MIYISNILLMVKYRSINYTNQQIAYLSVQWLTDTCTNNNKPEWCIKEQTQYTGITKSLGKETRYKLYSLVTTHKETIKIMAPWNRQEILTYV